MNEKDGKDTYFCIINDCNEECFDLDELTNHKIEKHDLLDKFWCEECYLARFTTQ